MYIRAWKPQCDYNRGHVGQTQNTSRIETLKEIRKDEKETLMVYLKNDKMATPTMVPLPLLL